MSIVMTPIGIVRGGRAEATDDGWDGVEADIVLDPAQVKADATLGLDAYSHIVVVFHMDRVTEAAIETGSRHPRERLDWPRVGILAQPARSRPNRIGVTAARLVGVDGLRLRVRGLDAIDGTPVLDVKPYITGFSPRDRIREPAWVTELMRTYW